MASLDKPPLATPTVKWRFPDMHPEGRKYVLIVGAFILLSLIFWDVATWPLIGLAVWVAAFFRDPVRVTPQGEGLIIAPADGLVTMIERVPVPRELAGENGLGDAPLVRVSIFMSVFDVHINRTPIAGTIRQVVYISGKFLNADLDKASEENERQHIVVEGRDGRRVGFTQIAGPGGAADRRIREAGRHDRERAARRSDPLWQSGGCVPARRHRAAGRPWPAQHRGRDDPGPAGCERSDRHRAVNGNR